MNEDDPKFRRFVDLAKAHRPDDRPPALWHQATMNAVRSISAEGGPDLSELFIRTAKRLCLTSLVATAALQLFLALQPVSAEGDWSFFTDTAWLSISV